MNVGELRTLLAAYPDDMEIFYQDGNFGGPAGDFGAIDISVFRSVEFDVLLINAPYWVDCESE